MGVRHKRISKKKKRQKGGAMFMDKIAEGASMFLADPSFAKLGAKLMGQAARGISNNVKYYRKRQRR